MGTGKRDHRQRYSCADCGASGVTLTRYSTSVSRKHVVLLCAGCLKRRLRGVWRNDPR